MKSTNNYYIFKAAFQAQFILAGLFSFHVNEMGMFCFIFNLQVNYEKLLCFLKVAASDDSQQSQRAADSSPRKAEGGNHHSERYFLPFVGMLFLDFQHWQGP